MFHKTPQIDCGIEMYIANMKQKTEYMISHYTKGLKNSRWYDIKTSDFLTDFEHVKKHMNDMSKKEIIKDVIVRRFLKNLYAPCNELLDAVQYQCKNKHWELIKRYVVPILLNSML